MSYDLDENTYEQAEINDPFVLRLLQDLQELLKPAKNTLKPLNKTDLALSVATYILRFFYLNHILLVDK